MKIISADHNKVNAQLLHAASWKRRKKKADILFEIKNYYVCNIFNGIFIKPLLLFRTCRQTLHVTALYLWRKLHDIFIDEMKTILFFAFYSVVDINFSLTPTFEGRILWKRTSVLSTFYSIDKTKFSFYWFLANVDPDGWAF